jgi:hypothetical protein
LQTLTHPNERRHAAQYLETVQTPVCCGILVRCLHSNHTKNKGNDKKHIRDQRNDIPECEDAPQRNEVKQFEDLNESKVRE